MLVLVFGLRWRWHDGQGSITPRVAGAATGTRGALARRLAPHPLAHDDADRDGIPDSLEASLADRYAPVVILDAREHNRPASIDWLLARVAPPGSAPVGLVQGLLAGRFQIGGHEFSDAVRAGSSDPRDWVTYVHVYPRTDGGISLQYWFFYTYNDGPLFFDHEGDWEHVTVALGPDGAPEAVYFAEHGNNNPGLYRSWRSVRREGDHPVVLSARGSHASYPDLGSVAWFDHASSCAQLQACGAPVWRTWEAGGLTNVGERGAALGLGEVMRYRGRWGSDGRFLRSSPAPRAPTLQGGFLAGGFD